MQDNTAVQAHYPDDYFNQLKGAETVLLYSDKIKDIQSLKALEPKLRKLDNDMAKDHMALIKQFAAAEGLKWVGDTEPEVTLMTKQDACVIRYLLVPLLYKLGLTSLAAFYDGMTFNFLFPFIHETLASGLMQLFGSAEQHVSNIISKFTPQSNNIENFYYRIKSINSIWKKLSSTTEFLKMDAKAFSAVVDDYMAFRWGMKLLPNENRYDALINGVRLMPVGWHYFRNQQLPQSEGFDCEPVMKFYFLEHGLPVEIQLLGGPHIECYMCAKGYSNYKCKMVFPPKKEALSDKQWESRLGMSLEYSAPMKTQHFRKLMLQELLEESVEYPLEKCFHLDEKPLNKININHAFLGSDKPVYVLKDYTAC